MGKAWLSGTVLAGCLAAAVAGAAPALAQSRFLSYASEADCVAAGALGASLCRSAFANARAEFAAKTPTFASMAQCAKAYGACAPWPPGASARASFRPRWDGVDILDTPKEKSVTPAVASGSKRLAFAPQPLTAFRSLDVRGPARGAGRPEAPPPGSLRSRGFARGPAPGPAGPPPPGSGFKLEDGVLTFPAPARFQPRNLPRQP